MNHNQSNNGKIPDGWIRANLGELVTIKYGKGLPTNQLKETGYPVFGANGIIGLHSEYLYEESQVLISCRGAYSGKINLSPPKCFITNNSLVLELSSPVSQLQKFLYYALQVADKSKLVTGSAQPQVTINNANVLQVLVPPLPEHQRIVAKIEELFTKLDAGIEALKQAKKRLKRYRQSVLQQAFAGKLTNENVEESELPKSWKWVTLADVAKVSGGLTKNSKREALALKLPFLRVANVYFNSLNLAEVPKYRTKVG